jgi:hypothetical protein
MTTAISSANHTDPTAASANQPRPAAKSPTPSQPKSATLATDTVSISSAARAAQQESLETPAQTAKEAGAGDHQAQRLLAREAAARK